MAHPYRSPSSPTPVRPTRSTRRAPRPFGSRPKKPIPLWERILLGVFGGAVLSLFVGLGTLAYRDFFPTKEKPGIRFVERPPAPAPITSATIMGWQNAPAATGFVVQSNDVYFRASDGTSYKIGEPSSRLSTVAPYRAVRNKLAPR